ncbi:hypothetical protein PISL3812_08010 [Talaromyces islandicus]|uniref:Uncharacterized protein n=1 Tax=Talaromyces islandicus TaxID=28573 RepID=A0A0U1M6J6_TALIS|nr:hypothetical protein PISL3812_08010 [Talaromyces islandicus]
MYSPVLFALSLAGTLGLAAADGAPVFAVTVYSEADCQGDAVVEYIGTNRDYCFGSQGGNSIGSIQALDTSRCDSVVTYSGAECQGTYASFAPTNTDCNNVPFASLQLKCA